eukprot:m.19273 g.19273  ORF g.19273 m.19273 type:complete len:373 (-) comp5092_c0_seq1:7-1125(-)
MTATLAQKIGVLVAMWAFLSMYFSCFHWTLRINHPILIIGGTGEQGYSAIKYLHEHGLRNLRTISRNSSSLAAVRIQDEFGVDVVEGDYGSKYLLRQVMKGCSAVLVVTFSEFERPKREELIGEILMDAAAENGVWHVSLSSGDKTGIEWLDIKHHLENYLFQHHGGSFASSSAIRSGFFFDNLFFKGGEQRFMFSEEEPQPESKSARKYQLKLFSGFPSDFSVPMHAASDVGTIAAAHMTSFLYTGVPWKHEIVRVVGDYISGSEMCKVVEQHFSKKKLATLSCSYTHLSAADIKDMIAGVKGERIAGIFEHALRLQWWRQSNGGNGNDIQPKRVQEEKGGIIGRYPFLVSIQSFKTWFEDKSFIWFPTLT